MMGSSLVLLDSALVPRPISQQPGFPFWAISVSVDHTCQRNWDDFYDQMKQLLCNFAIIGDRGYDKRKDRDPRLINTLSGSSFESNKPSNMVAPGDEISRAGFLERGTMGDCVQLLMPDDNPKASIETSFNSPIISCSGIAYRCFS